MNDLWRVYEYDEKYCQLKIRKENLNRLFERMRKYQTNEKIPQLNKKRFKKVLPNKNDDEFTEVEDELVVNIIDSTRLITGEDISNQYNQPKNFLTVINILIYIIALT